MISDNFNDSKFTKVIDDLILNKKSLFVLRLPLDKIDEMARKEGKNFYQKCFEIITANTANDKAQRWVKGLNKK